VKLHLGVGVFFTHVCLIGARHLMSCGELNMHSTKMKQRNARVSFICFFHLFLSVVLWGRFGVVVRRVVENISVSFS